MAFCRFASICLLALLTSCGRSRTGSVNDAECVPTTGGDFAHRSYPSPLSTEQAKIILVCTTNFEIGMWPPKRQGQAFNVLYRRSDALQQFQAVATRGGPAGRLYAFAAFEALSPEAARTLKDELLSDKRPVLFQDNDQSLGIHYAGELIPIIHDRHLADEFRRNESAIDSYFRAPR